MYYRNIRRIKVLTKNIEFKTFTPPITEYIFDIYSKLQSSLQTDYKIDGLKKFEVADNFNLVAKRDIRYIVVALMKLDS